MVKGGEYICSCLGLWKLIGLFKADPWTLFSLSLSLLSNFPFWHSPWAYPREDSVPKYVRKRKLLDIDMESITISKAAAVKIQIREMSHWTWFCICEGGVIRRATATNGTLISIYVASIHIFFTKISSLREVFSPDSEATYMYSSPHVKRDEWERVLSLSIYLLVFFCMYLLLVYPMKPKPMHKHTVSHSNPLCVCVCLAQRLYYTFCIWKRFTVGRVSLSRPLARAWINENPFEFFGGDAVAAKGRRKAISLC